MTENPFRLALVRHAEAQHRQANAVDQPMRDDEWPQVAAVGPVHRAGHEADGGARPSTTRVVTPSRASSGPEGQLRPAAPELERVVRQGAATEVSGGPAALGVLEGLGGEGTGRQPDFGGCPRAAGGGLGA